VINFMFDESRSDWRLEIDARIDIHSLSFDRAIMNDHGDPSTRTTHTMTINQLVAFGKTHNCSSSRPRRSNRAGAIRMAHLRDRRLRGFRCYSIEVCEDDLDALTRRGFLDRLERDDPMAIQAAIGRLLDRIYQL
jgi:hypothetical protein